MIEWNELIYVGAELFCDKIGIPLRDSNRSTTPGWEIRQNLKKLRQVKVLRKEITQGYVGMKRLV